MTTTPPAPPVRGAKRRARTRAAILDAAEQMIAEDSLDAIRIEDVATRAGVSPASVYVHFQTKDGLLAATVDRLLTVSTEALEAALSADLEPFDRFLGIGAAYIRLLLEHPALVRYFAIAEAPASETDQAVDRRLSDLRARFEGLIRELIEAGRMREVDARELSYFLMGAWQGAAALALRKDSLALDRAAIERSVVEAGLALARGLAPDDRR